MDIKAFGLGRIIAVGVIILCIVLAVIGRVDTVTAGAGRCNRAGNCSALSTC